MKLKIDDMVLISKYAWQDYLVKMGKSTDIPIPPPQRVVGIRNTKESLNPVQSRVANITFNFGFAAGGDLAGQVPVAAKPAKYKYKTKEPIGDQIQLAFPIDSIWNEEDLEPCQYG